MAESTAEWYRRAAGELAPHSALHGAWAAALADDAEVLQIVDALPPAQRHPSLLFAVADLLGASTEATSYSELRAWLLEHAGRLAAAAHGRRTQTNEVGRSAPLAAALARLDGPIVLLELGAAAGLCLALDRWTIAFDGDDGATSTLGAGEPVVRCRVPGPGPLPTRLPRILDRRGVDLAPLDPLDPGDARWLEALTPVDRPDRRERLAAALAAVAVDPVPVVAGDVAELIAEPERMRAIAPEVPVGARLVVVSLGTLVYLHRDVRARFLDAVRAIGAHAITLEGTNALPEVSERAAGRDSAHPTGHLLALDGEPLAHVTPHGDRLAWLR
ncbi:DUF2332 family protein [Schumannella sp. 10F1B-5-1]|uniref:DUF2332 family protein n=1 Tax=Schumannella sp. 10F1B-5-1 TaxID=2590780 RepID=UPI001130BD6E|nr:DUF2332 family protein [Schumannella sp. 10F1B-5-1]TPW72863.1 DUF2332 family protein [Schumannella sp. 10F1B-5-1]